MRVRNRRLRRALGPAAVAIIVLVVCAPAGAATLGPQYDYCYGETCSRSAVFTSSSVVNKLVVAGQGKDRVVLRDPNVAISTPAERDVPRFDERLVGSTEYWLLNGRVAAPVWATFNCIAPSGRGNAACIATPGFGDRKSVV